ncbi:SRPBCC family protein [Lacisediminihabitans sp.]|uniref:SRPBCC family protein n=1 Tax=Lacisediminihabitans sp. TaxID=2787631 RepID=UPI00374C92C3
MSTNTRVMSCTPEAVFAVLRDGWLFPVWVVGASRMRAVDARWPGVGSALHHSFGAWPFLINDETRVEESSEPTHLVLRAKGWPIGEARVQIDIEPHARGCRVRIAERAISGPGALLPDALMNIPLFLRNIETLKRLAYIAEGREENGELTIQTKQPFERSLTQKAPENRGLDD